MNYKRIAAAAVAMAFFGCGVKDAALTGDDLGDPVRSQIPPVVVPKYAELNPSMSSPSYVTYVMPEAVNEGELIQWYRQHMPPHRNFDRLVWLQRFPPLEAIGEVWYWCDGMSQTLSIAFEQHDTDNSGRAFVSIAIEEVDDGACG